MRAVRKDNNDTAKSAPYTETVESFPKKTLLIRNFLGHSKENLALQQTSSFFLRK